MLWPEKMMGRFKKIFLFFLLALIGLPTLFVRWALSDDGVIIFKAKTISELIFSLNFSGLLVFLTEKEIGRFRPVYYLSYWLVYLIDRKHTQVYYFFHLLILLGIAWLIFKICSFLFEKNVGFWAVFLFFVSYLNMENWYRLGPQEPLAVFYFLLSFYLFFLVFSKKRLSLWLKVFSFVFLIFAYFTKETNIAFTLPIGLLYFFMLLTKGGDKRKNQKYNFLFLQNYFLFSLFLASVIILIGSSLRFEGAYTSNYLLDFKVFISNFTSFLRVISGSFFPLFPFVFIIFFLSCFIKLKTNLWAIFFLFCFLSFLVIQSPWNFLLARYLMPSLVGLVIFLALAISKIERKIKNLCFRRVFVVGLISFLFVQNFSQSANIILLSVLSSKVTKGVLGYVAQSAPKNSTVYFNYIKSGSVLEHLLESELHLKLFFDRPDLKIERLEQDLVLPSKTIIVSAFVSENFLYYPEEKIEKDFNLKKEKTWRYTSLTFTNLTFWRLRNLNKKIIEEKHTDWKVYQKI